MVTEDLNAVVMIPLEEEQFQFAEEIPSEDKGINEISQNEEIPFEEVDGVEVCR